MLLINKIGVFDLKFKTLFKAGFSSYLQLFMYNQMPIYKPLKHLSIYPPPPLNNKICTCTAFPHFLDECFFPLKKRKNTNVRGQER